MDARAASSATAVPRWIDVGFISEFPLEWAAVAVLALTDVVWAARIGFSFAVSPRDFAVLVAIFAASVFFRTFYLNRRGSLIAEFCALTITVTCALQVLSYLCCATSWPLADTKLLQLDRMIGFDWLHWFRVVQSHPVVLPALRWIYGSVALQDIYFLALFGMLCNQVRLREMFWVIFMACLTTFAISIFMPAYGPFETFRLGDLGGYLAEMKRVRHGGELHFDLGKLIGVISFPSFHTSLAIIFTYMFRRTGPIGAVIAAVNLIMLPTIPFIGGHYLVDMFAGAAVAGTSIVTVRFWLRSKTLAKHTWQHDRAALACNGVEPRRVSLGSSQVRLPEDKQCGSYVAFQRRFRAVAEQWTPKWLSSR